MTLEKALQEFRERFTRDSRDFVCEYAPYIEKFISDIYKDLNVALLGMYQGEECKCNDANHSFCGSSFNEGVNDARSLLRDAQSPKN